jgi:hypothetical protein
MIVWRSRAPLPARDAFSRKEGPGRRLSTATTHIPRRLLSIFNAAGNDAASADLRASVHGSAECLRLARRTIGKIQSVTIRRLRKGTRPNWKVADIIPQPSVLVSTKIRGRLARLMDKYVLEDESK